MRIKKTILIESEIVKRVEAKAKRDGVSVNRVIEGYCRGGIEFSERERSLIPARALERLHKEEPDYRIIRNIRGY
jgi:hypothetical protein